MREHGRWHPDSSFPFNDGAPDDVLERARKLGWRDRSPLRRHPFELNRALSRFDRGRSGGGKRPCQIIRRPSRSNVIQPIAMELIWPPAGSSAARRNIGLLGEPAVSGRWRMAAARASYSGWAR